MAVWSNITHALLDAALQVDIALVEGASLRRPILRQEWAELLGSWPLRSISKDFLILLLLVPKLLEIFSKPQIYSYSNNLTFCLIFILKWIFNFGILWLKILYFLTIAPKAWIQQIKHNRALTFMSIFHWMIFINLTKAYKKVLWVLDALLNLYIIWFVTMSFDLELPVVNTMKWQILTHDCRKATIISRLTYFVSFYFKVAVLRILNNFIWEIFNFDAQIKVFKVKKCV